MNTAIDFYSRGKEKEAEAKDYSISAWYPRGRFICPECGEDVCLTKSKYRNFFRHYKRTNQTPECERRVDSTPTESIYEKIGLPLYLKEETEGNFSLFIGFHKIPDYELEKASETQAEILIDRRTRYLINQERFLANHGYRMPIDFAPASDHYHIEYRGDSSQKKWFERNWGNYAEAFFSHGAIFTSPINGHRKLHKGDSISTDVNYIWVIRDPVFLDKIPGLNYSIIGTLSLTNRIYRVCRIYIHSDISDEDYQYTSRLLLKELKLHLLEKESTITPIWPPLVQQGDRFIVNDKTKTVFGAVKSGNKSPVVYGYYKDLPIPENIKAGNESVILMPLKQEYQYFTVDRKNVSTGIVIEKGNYYSNNVVVRITVSINNSIQENYKDYLSSEDSLCIETSILTNLILIQNNAVKIIRQQKRYEITQTKKTTHLLIFNNADLLLVIKNNAVSEAEEHVDTHLTNMLIKYANTYCVDLPISVRKKLMEFTEKDIRIRQILRSNKIPLVILQYIGGMGNAQ